MNTKDELISGVGRVALCCLLIPVYPGVARIVGYHSDLMLLVLLYSIHSTSYLTVIRWGGGRSASLDLVHLVQKGVSPPYLGWLVGREATARPQQTDVTLSTRRATTCPCLFMKHPFYRLGAHFWLFYKYV